jgi:uncharacterized membrane protein
MAGIGFRLQKLVQGDTYVRASAAYLSSAIIVAGPLLSSVVALLLLSGASAAFLDQPSGRLLMATISYAFGVSLVLTSGPQLIITRYLADRFYVKDHAAVAPILNGVLLLALPLVVIAAPFLLLAPFDWRYRLLTVTLFLALSLNWLVSVFLSATRYFADIVLSYVIGHGVSLGSAIWFGHALAFIGSLAGYTLGQVLCMLLLVAHVFLEFSQANGISLAFVIYVKRYWQFLVLGFLATVGIWADNVMYWFGPGSIVVAGFYRSNPAYDAMKLLGYLTTIPASVVFLVHIETRFFHHYRSFYRQIEERGTLEAIMRAKHGMIEAAKTGVVNVFLLQFIVVGTALLFAPDILRLLHLPASRVGLFRMLVLAANIHVTMTLGGILLLYLDERYLALLVAAVFVLCNLVFTFVTTLRGTHFAGSGYLIASAVASIVALLSVTARLRRLEYRTFMLQPLGESK